MAKFAYKARTRDGQTVTAVRESDSLAHAAEELRASGLAVISIAPAAADRGHSPALLPRWHPAWLVPMRSLDVEMGLRQLASMLTSGVSVLLSLTTVEEQASCPRAAAVWADLAEIIRAGGTVSDAMNRHAKIFPEEVVQLARTGERTGELAVALTRAADQLEAHRNLHVMVANALIYPCIATVMAIGVSAYLVVVVIPKVAEFLASGNVNLPAMTQMLMNVSFWVRAKGLAILIVLLALVIAWGVLRRFPAGREVQDVVLLRVPLIGRIFRLSATASFARAMALLVGSGVTLVDSLRVAGQMLKNRRLRRRIATAREAVVHGEALSASLAQAPEFLPMLARMTAVAETTGSLAETFTEVARFHETLLSITIRRFSLIIEPVMIVFTGGLVGFVYISFFMALFSMASMQ